MQGSQVHNQKHEDRRSCSVHNLVNGDCTSRRPNRPPLSGVRGSFVDLVTFVLELDVVVQENVVFRVVASKSVPAKIEVSWRTRDNDAFLARAQMNDVTV